MQNVVDDRRPSAAFAPDRRLTIAAAAGAIVAVVALVGASDGAGRFLAAVAALVLIGYVVGDMIFRPRLTASAQGLVVRAPTARAHLGWHEVDNVRADTYTRWGMRSTTLEIDAADTLVILTRRALGADPVEVAELVNAFRPL